MSDRKQSGGPPGPPLNSPTTAAAKRAEVVSSVGRGHDTAGDPLPTTPARAESVASRVRAWLGLSDERDIHLRRLLAAERASYDRGYEDGRADALAEQEDAWHDLAVRLVGDNRSACYCHEFERDKAARRVAAAIAYTRWAAAHQWRQFTRSAFAERPDRRSAAQQAAVEMTRKQRGAA